MITSVSNPRVKEIRKLRERKEQKRTGLFYMEGTRIVGEALEKGAEIEMLVVCPELLKTDYSMELWQKAQKQGLDIFEVSRPVFESLAVKENPQGLAAVAKARFFSLDDLDTTHGIIVALTEIADPGNLGTIIRTADAVDAQGVILIGDCTSPYDIGSIRGTMGAIFSTKIVRTTLPEFLAWKQRTGLQLIGTSDKSATDYVDIAYADPVILLMGSERAGMSPEEFEACDEIAAIPMMRSSDSLNLAVATGIMLYQIFNQHRARK
ncbi:MAG: RNA methyltransferase [Anaerolineaceae bacterium]|nr:RNA methyltransferase [Anaerolineaceae bacterium]